MLRRQKERKKRKCFCSLFCQNFDISSFFNAIPFFSSNDCSYSCFDHFDQSTESYAFATYFRVSPSCEKEVVRVLTELAKRHSEYITRENLSSEKDEDELFCAEINAMVVKDSEEYYRT